ncbi:hypothetical protein [Halobacillus litoralis]|uniref:hypothetical protein n=1 Tax=Halobacillus litoralis TaxID=45668 RepID=UPI0013E8D376|nr:hypothetical protein [Halobacillus litoralis]
MIHFHTSLGNLVLFTVIIGTLPEPITDAPATGLHFKGITIREDDLALYFQIQKHGLLNRLHKQQLVYT